MTVSEIVASNAKYLAHKEGMFLKELEDAVGVCHGYFAQVKKMNRVLPIDIAVRIADEFGVSLEYLISKDLAREEKIKRLEAELAELKGE